METYSTVTLLVSLWQLFIEMFAYGVQHK